MELPTESVLLRIFLSEQDHCHGRPLYEVLVLKARKVGLAGATVLRGAVGYGHTSRLHTTKVLRLSDDLPLVVEIVDTKERIDAFLPVLQEMMHSGLITLERAEVLHYGAKERKSP